MLQYITDKFESIPLNLIDFYGVSKVHIGLSNHYCFLRGTVYHLIIHGNKEENKVNFNDKLVDFSELIPLIRNEKNIPDNEEVIIKVYTCYGGNMPYYIDSHNLVVSAFANLIELRFEPKLNSFEFAYA